MFARQIRSTISRFALVGLTAGMLVAGGAALTPGYADASTSAANCAHLMSQGDYYARVGRKLADIGETKMAIEFFHTAGSYYSAYAASCS
jgi:hypothetical protein